MNPSTSETPTAIVAAPQVSSEKRSNAEQPIKKQVWEQAPTGNVEDSIRDRVAEFFRAPEVPANFKALGVLSTEMLVKASRELGLDAYRVALTEGGAYARDPTIYGMTLFSDRLDLALTPVPDYGHVSIHALSLPVSALELLTGNLASDLAEERPGVVDALLTTEPGERAFYTAKVSLMRYLAGKKPGSVKQFGEMGGLYPAHGLAYTVDGRSMVAKLYRAEIPDTDPILGEAIEFYNNAEAYRSLVTKMEMSEFQEMTVDKIEQYLKTLPSWAQRLIIGKHHSMDAGPRANRIFEMLEILGYQGNEAQQKWRKTRVVSAVFTRFSGELRKKILASIEKNTPPEELGLSTADIDAMFRASYQDAMKYEKPPKELANDFSITAAVTGKVPLSDLPV